MSQTGSETGQISLLTTLAGSFSTRPAKAPQIGGHTAIKVLKKHGNILIFPEGTWNITENKPVMNLYTGAAEMAIESGADIIPLAVERYGDTWFINIGENISSEKYDPDMKRELTDDLRDAMATLKWEIFEKYGHIRREELPDNASEQWLANIQKNELTAN